MDAAWAPGGRAPLCFQSAPYRLMMSLAESRSCPSAHSCAHTLGHPPSPYTHTLIASLASPHGEGPLVVFALVWWGTVDVNTVNSLCSDTSTWTRRVRAGELVRIRDSEHGSRGAWAGRTHLCTSSTGTVPRWANLGPLSWKGVGWTPGSPCGQKFAWLLTPAPRPARQSWNQPLFPTSAVGIFRQNSRS